MNGQYRFSLSLKFSVVIMLMSLLIGAIVVLIGYEIYQQQIVSRYEQAGAALFETAGATVDWDKVGPYYETGTADEEYWHTLDNMRICAKAGAAQYVYVIKPLDEELCAFIYDTDESSDRYGLGEVESIDSAVNEYSSFLDPNKRSEPAITNEGDYGWMLSLYQPFYDSQGAFVGYLGIDYNIEQLIREEQDFIFRLSIATLVVAVAMTAVFLVILRFLLLKPINKIAYAANSYLVEEDGGGATAERSSIAKLDIRTRDELQSLAGSLQSMEQKIQSYIANLEETNLRAETDPLTGLYNRRAFDKRIDAILGQGHASDAYYVFMMIDLDYFKEINDTYGHKVGDEVLVACSSAIRSHFRDDDLVARMGGDEFAVFYRSPRSIEEVEERAAAVCDSARAILVRGTIGVTVSIGVAVCTGRLDCQSQEMYLAADDVLYEVKERGRDGFAVQTDE